MSQSIRAPNSLQCLFSKDITLGLLKKAMERAAGANGFLIDGFPRKLDQAEAFEREIGTCKFVLYFECNERTLEHRLLTRGQTSGRSDDNAESIKKRFVTFKNTSFPVIQYYMNNDKCVKVGCSFFCKITSRVNYRRSHLSCLLTLSTCKSENILSNLLYCCTTILFSFWVRLDQAKGLNAPDWL